MLNSTFGREKLLRTLGCGAFFTPININVGLTQLIIDHRKAFDQVPKPPELCQLLLGCFDPIVRNVVPNRFLIFIFTGQLPARMSRVVDLACYIPYHTKLRKL